MPVLSDFMATALRNERILAPAPPSASAPAPPAAGPSSADDALALASYNDRAQSKNMGPGKVIIASTFRLADRSTRLRRTI